MSHEISSYPPVEETINPVASNEHENNSRVAELHAYIAQNSEVLVESPRAPGYKAPLGLLMSMCPEEVTAENVDEFFAEAQSMIANSAPETEAKTEEAETEEETVEKDDKTEHKQKAKPPEEKPSNVEQEKVITSKQEVQKTEQPQTITSQKHEVAADNFITAKTETAKGTLPINSEISQSSAVNNAFEKMASLPSAAPARQLQSAESPSAAVEPLAVSAAVYSAESKSPDPIGAVIKELTVTSPNPAVIDNELIMKQGIPAAAEDSGTTVPEIEEYNILFDKNPQTEEIFRVPDPLIEENYAPIETEDIEGAGEDIEAYLHIDSDEQSELPEDFAEYELPEEQTGKSFIHPVLEAPTINASEYIHDNPKPVTELSLPVEEVEKTILQMADKIEKMEAKTAQSAQQILDAIAHKLTESPARVESNQENLETASETENIEQELKELFIQLFDRVEIECSAELIEACVKLALHGDITELITNTEPDQTTDQPGDRGTHEMIKRLLAALNNFKKSVIHACEIGKSALQLYSQQIIAVR